MVRAVAGLAKPGVAGAVEINEVDVLAVGGGVIETHIPHLANRQILEVGPGIEGKGAVIVIGDRALGWRAETL